MTNSNLNNKKVLTAELKKQIEQENLAAKTEVSTQPIDEKKAKKEKEQSESMEASFSAIGANAKENSNAVRGGKNYLYKFQLADKVDKDTAKKMRSKLRRELLTHLKDIELQSKLFFITKVIKDKQVFLNAVSSFKTFLLNTYVSQDIFDYSKFQGLDEKNRIIDVLENIKKYDL